jgi:hypothetical protein
MQLINKPAMLVGLSIRESCRDALLPNDLQCSGRWRRNGVGPNFEQMVRASSGSGYDSKPQSKARNPPGPRITLGRRSQCLASRRTCAAQTKVRSAIHRLGSRTKSFLAAGSLIADKSIHYLWHPARAALLFDSERFKQVCTRRSLSRLPGYVHCKTASISISINARSGRLVTPTAVLAGDSAPGHAVRRMSEAASSTAV